MIEISRSDKAWLTRMRRKVALRKLKSKAHGLVASALKSGKLVKGLCEGCGSDCVDGHHYDYNKPLSVVWLCRSCHVRVHRSSHFLSHILRPASI